MKRPHVDLAALTEGAPLRPLAILFALNAVEAFDSSSFSVLLPEIKDAFHLSSETALTVVALLAPVAILLSLPLAHHADRLPRVRIAAAGAAVWGAFSVFTGMAVNLPMLVVARSGAGIGKSVNLPTHSSLLSDYYPVDVRGRVFATYQASQATGNIIGPIVAGILTVAISWRAPFIVGAVATAAVVLLAVTLREPTRGAHERIAAGGTIEDAAHEEAPARFDESWRSLYAVATLRRMYFSLPLLAGSIVGLHAVLALFFEKVYGVGAVGRGVLFAGNECFVLLGLLVGAPIAQRTMRDDPSRALRLLIVSSAGVAVAIAVMAASPNLAVAVVAGWAQAAMGALIYPALGAIFSLVIPPRSRSLGFAAFAVWALPGVVVLPVVGGVGDAHGFRLALTVLIPLYLAGGFLLSTARASVNHDIDNTQRWALLEGRARHERIEFERSVEAGEIDLARFNLLEVRDVEFSYGPVQVLFGVDLDVPYGSKVALLGTNGAGKSTLLKVISGLVMPDPGTGGTVWFDHVNITHLLPEDRAELGLVQIGGGRATFPTLTVEENLRMGAVPFLRDKARVDERVEEALELFPVLRSRARQRAGTLSGGEQQMMALGRAFIAGPKLLMVDELSLGLAPVVMQDVLAAVEEIVRRGTTLILVEQSLNVALAVADTAYFMEKGEIRFSGPAADLLERDDLVRSVFFGDAPATAGRRR